MDESKLVKSKKKEAIILPVHHNQPQPTPPKLISSIATLPLSSSLSLPHAVDQDPQLDNEKQHVFCIITSCSFIWLVLSVFTWTLAVAGSLSPNWINKSLNEVYITFDNLQLPFATQHHYQFPHQFNQKPSFLLDRSSPKSSSFFHPDQLIAQPDSPNIFQWQPPPLPPPTMLISSLGPFGGCAGLSSVLDTWPSGCEPNIRRLLQFADRVQPLWHASQVSQLLGLTVYVIALVGALVGTCKQSIHRKSIFTISGTVQAFAGKLIRVWLNSAGFDWFNSISSVPFGRSLLYAWTDFVRRRTRRST